MNTLLENNKLMLAGQVITEPVFYHEAYDEKFYSFDLKVARLSQNHDIVPVLISEKILDQINVGDCISMEGQLRTYNKYEEETKRKLLMFAFVKEVSIITQEELDAIKNPNELTVIGYLCKAPSYRVTPLGREIADLLVAVNRAYKKSDYIPTIAWGRNAKYCEKLEVGTCVQLTGRVQSREYVKRIDDTSEGETRVAYEVSINRIKVVTEEESQA